MGTKPQHSRAYRRLCVLLSRWRNNAGLTQRALAALLRKPHSFVYKCESGNRRLDATEFILWTKACGVDPRDAISETERAMNL